MTRRSLSSSRRQECRGAMMGARSYAMEQSDFDELIQGAKQFGAHLATVYRELTGEDLDIETAIRHYPLVAIGVAAGAGAVGGWFVARRGRKQLPAPSPPPPPSPPHLSYVERLIPEGLERVREILPESFAEEAATQARAWVEDVLEPRLKEGMESAVSNFN